MRCMMGTRSLSSLGVMSWFMVFIQLIVEMLGYIARHFKINRIVALPIDADQMPVKMHKQYLIYVVESMIDFILIPDALRPGFAIS